jgi:protoheme IX farnesyltransferase
VTPAGRAEPLAGLAVPSAAADFLALLKPRVVALIAVTTAAGFYLGSGARFDWIGFAVTVVATALAGGGALGLNQFLEIDVDARMKRTRNRPLPGGRLGSSEALAFAATLVIAGLGLQVAVNPVSALITALTVASYLFAYTPLKRRSALCTVVGAVPGALPPVSGWAAAAGGLGPGAWALFGILFFWQLPHSLAIARLYRDDYEAGGLRLLPVVDRDGKSTGRQVLINSLALLAAGMAPALVGIAGPVYLVLSLVLGAGLLGLALGFWREDTRDTARRLYLGSLAYLPLLLLALTLDKRLP